MYIVLLLYASLFSLKSIVFLFLRQIHMFLLKFKYIFHSLSIELDVLLYRGVLPPK